LFIHLFYFVFYRFAKQYQDKKWVVVCEEDTRMDLKRLLHLLQQHDESEVGEMV